MFSGIIEELGVVESISRRGRVTLLSVYASQVLLDTKIGDSIAVNGACLTVVKKEAQSLSFEVMAETLQGTNLNSLRISDKVNLERSLKIGDRLSGHFVTGHVDYVGIIRKKTFLKDNLCFEIALPAAYVSFIVPKGSIAVDGISLTVMDKKSSAFRVCIIPHTLKNTTLGFKGPSSKVNIECDMLLKLDRNATLKHKLC